jgi:hypothetical protein
VETQTGGRKMDVNYDGTIVYDTVLEPFGYQSIEPIESCYDDEPEAELVETFDNWE